ncbi:arsenate reductase (glutaredoxin) [Oligella sp. HMSC05A10]|uniref:arsenate reductase (glutaredoxin) n=1 Tax=Oligella TaxID=90243 RepID=UPI0003636BD5|nr:MULTISPECIES: arsenate reductase (glutaredoxin) [Oligella]AVL70323.1 arsenate reductase (glutaredoxin) [Oligella urethralis]OFS87349.1 arsenate reductase (glutaredoxin) [Oligella sp. HMSC05A10]SUA59553.1 Arsenate reductase [Oligella urethralis]SUA62528.1 Arsenate reductase [Oligella urethralis]SUA68754.1 Arsenate reductase [Oligella urethralis]
MSKVTIYHNPRCGTSRNVLALINATTAELEVIEYLKTPPSKEQLAKLVADSGLAIRDFMRQKESLYQENDLDNAKWSDEELLDWMVKEPILMNRPVVVTEAGTRLCRPKEVLFEILPAAKAADN